MSTNNTEKDLYVQVGQQELRKVIITLLIQNGGVDMKANDLIQYADVIVRYIQNGKEMTEATSRSDA